MIGCECDNYKESNQEKNQRNVYKMKKRKLRAINPRGAL